MIAAPSQRDNARLVVANFWQSTKPVRLRNMATWAESEIKLPSGPAEGRRYKIDRLPYARLLFNELGKWRRHVITGPTQSGKTLHAYVIPMLYYLFEMKEDVICGIPDLNMASVKWQEDIRPAIEASSYANQIPTHGPGSKGGNPTRIQFQNGRSLLFMAGGGNDKQRAGATSRVLMITETDGMDEVSASSKEGQDKISQLEGRVRAFGLDSLTFMECTVTTEEGRTWKEYTNGTASKIICPCVHCGDWVTPEREHFTGWQDADNKMEAGEKAAFTCPECGGFYTEEHRTSMNQDAKLLHRGQEVTPDGEIVGEPIKTDTLGFRWSAFNNLLAPMQQIGMEEWQISQQEDNEVAVITIKQQGYAIPAKNTNVDKVQLNTAIVRGSDRRYSGRLTGHAAGQIPEGTTTLTAFIDCGKRELQWSVEASVSYGWHVVDYGVFETDIPDIKGDEKAVEDAIVDLTSELDRRFPDLDCGLVDAGNWSDTVRNTTARISWKWNPSHGLPTYRHPVGEREDRFLPTDGCRIWHWSLVNGVWVVNFHPDAFKKQVHAAFMVVPQNGDDRATGSVSIFGEDPNQHTQFAKEITAEEWQSEFHPGKGVREGFVPIRKRNHWLDTTVGNRLARLVVKEWRLAQQAEEQTEQTESTTAVTTPDGRPFFVGERE